MLQKEEEKKVCRRRRSFIISFLQITLMHKGVIERIKKFFPTARQYLCRYFCVFNLFVYVKCNEMFNVLLCGGGRRSPTEKVFYFRLIPLKTL